MTKEKSIFEKNRDAFNKNLPSLEKKFRGKIVLFADGEFQGAYSNSIDAFAVGMRYHGKGKFYLREVGEKPSELGFIGSFV